MGNICACISDQHILNQVVDTPSHPDASVQANIDRLGSGLKQTSRLLQSKAYGQRLGQTLERYSGFLRERGIDSDMAVAYAKHGFGKTMSKVQPSAAYDPDTDQVRVKSTSKGGNITVAECSLPATPSHVVRIMADNVDRTREALSTFSNGESSYQTLLKSVVGSARTTVKSISEVAYSQDHKSVDKYLVNADFNLLAAVELSQDPGAKAFVRSIQAVDNLLLTSLSHRVPPHVMEGGQYPHLLAEGPKI